MAMLNNQMVYISYKVMLHKGGEQNSNFAFGVMVDISVITVVYKLNGGFLKIAGYPEIIQTFIDQFSIETHGFGDPPF
jgi:hypothetical protein